jgi:hypothetical protein
MVFVTLTIFANIRTASADNIAAFELRGVRVQMKDGRQLSGYLLWRSVMYRSPENADAQFPRILLDPKAWDPADGKPPDEVWFYRRVFPVSGPLSKHLYGKFLVSMQSEFLKLKLSQIARIKAVPWMKHNGYEGDFAVPLHSAFAIRLLTNEKPHAVIRDIDFDSVWISYNAHIGKKELARISEQIRRESSPQKQERMRRRAKRRRVVFLEVPTE